MAHTLTTIDDSDDEIPMLFEDSHRHPITDDYDILQDLGVGKFSVVRMAQNKRTKQKFAIKQIDRKVCPAELLVKEVNIMTKLSGCPGVIHLFDLYEEPDKPRTHLVMELVTGGELFDYIVKSSSYSEKSASDYIRQLCQTVEYLHSKNIVHRDLKPENMLFEDPSAQVLKLCDFGLADTLKDEFDFLTLAVGTKSYMAPEVSSNMGYGKPVDMYSIGVILYILLCGYLPIDPENGIYVLEFPPSEWSGISFEVKLLIKKLLDDSPAARPTATQVLKHPWVRGTNTSTKPLVGTLRNLQSWNQVGGRAITKPRGQVMDLFANPPPPPNAATASSTASSSTSSERKPASPNKPKVTKTKKAALPKLIDGAMVLPSANGESSPASTAAKKKPANSSSSAISAGNSSVNGTADASTSSKSPSAVKPKRKTDRVKSPKTTGDNGTTSPVVSSLSVTIKEPNNKDHKSTSSAESSSSTATSANTTTAAASREPKLKTQISERTKKFLEAQDAREATKRAESEERKSRRRSMGTPARSRDKKEVGGEKVEKPEKPEKAEKDKAKKDKKDKKDKTSTTEKEPAVDKKEKKEPVVAVVEKKEPVVDKAEKVARRKSRKDIPAPGNDLDAMIAAALRESTQLGPNVPQPADQRSASAGVKVRRAKEKNASPAADDTDAVLAKESSKKPKTRERSATTQEGPGSPVKDGAGSPRKKSKPPKVETSMRKSPSTSEVTSSTAEKGTKANGSPATGDMYPHRSSAPKLSTAAATKKASRKSMGSPSPSPKRSRPSPSNSPSASPRTLAAPSRAGSKQSVATSNVVTPTTKTITNKRASPIAVRDDSDSESYTTVSSSPSGDRPRIQLDTSSDSSNEKVVVKKKAPARKIIASTSSSSSRDS